MCSGRPISARPGISSTASNRCGCRLRCCRRTGSRNSRTRCRPRPRIRPSNCIFRRGSPAEAPRRSRPRRDTATNPAVIDAFALAIIASEAQPAYPGLRGHEPDLADARQHAGKIASAIAELRKVAPDPGSYVAESSFFEAGVAEILLGSELSKTARHQAEVRPGRPVLRPSRRRQRSLERRRIYKTIAGSSRPGCLRNSRHRAGGRRRISGP